MTVAEMTKKLEQTLGSIKNDVKYPNVYLYTQYSGMRVFVVYVVIIDLDIVLKDAHKYPTNALKSIKNNSITFMCRYNIDKTELIDKVNHAIDEWRLLNL